MPSSSSIGMIVSSARARTWKNWDAALVQYATLGRDRRVLGVEKHVELVRALLGVDVDDDFFVLKRGSVWMQVATCPWLACQ